MFFLCIFYFPWQVTYSLRRLSAFQTQNLYIGPQSESVSSNTKAGDLNPLFPGAEAKPDPIKGGLRVTNFFTYNCLAVSLSKNSSNSEMHWVKVSKKLLFQLLGLYLHITFPI